MPNRAGQSKRYVTMIEPLTSQRQRVLDVPDT